jgi:hypothetical protein
MPWVSKLEACHQEALAAEQSATIRPAATVIFVHVLVRKNATQRRERWTQSAKFSDPPNTLGQDLSHALARAGRNYTCASLGGKSLYSLSIIAEPP